MTTLANRSLNMNNNLAKITLAAIMATLVPGAAVAATQGPDGGGYTATDATPFNFVNIAGAGGGSSVLTGIDDGAVALTLPFSFTFYGVAYTNVCVSSNGAVYFVTDPNTCTQFNNATINDFQNQDLSSTAAPGNLPAIFPFWMDLTFADPGAGSVFYQTLGNPGNRRFVVQWQGVFPQGDGSTVTFQASLAEGTNSITFQYAAVNLGAGDANSNGGLATVAIRNGGAPGNNQQIQWSYNAAVLQDSYAILFQTSAAPGPPALTFPASGAAGVSPPVTLQWNTAAGALSYDVYLGTSPTPTVLVSPAQPGNTYLASGLGQSTTYYWNVVARNGTGLTPSAINSFVTAAAASGGGGGGGNTAPVTITWAVPTPISYGTPLGPDQLNAAASVPGSFSYSPAAGTILNAGQQPLTANFTPSGPGSSGGIATITLTVLPAPQTITFGAIPNKTTDDGLFSVAATASSGLPVVFTVSSGSATISANTVAISGPGTIVIQASQPGAGNFAAAKPVLQSFNVTVGSVKVISILNAASYSSGSLASDGYAAVFGSAFADKDYIAGPPPLSTSLGGATVTVTDVNGKSLDAGLYYVGYAQVNFVMPTGLAQGQGLVVITNAGGKKTSYAVNIAPVSPALFSGDASGKGAAAAVVINIAADGSIASSGLSYGCSGTPVVCKPTPINVGTGKVVLSLYGTGIRGRSGLGSVAVTVGGVAAKVEYAGSQPTYPGLDQVNVVLDSSLTGKGQVVLQLTIDGVAANPVLITIQ